MNKKLKNKRKSYLFTEQNIKRREGGERKNSHDLKQYKKNNADYIRNKLSTKTTTKKTTTIIELYSIVELLNDNTRFQKSIYRNKYLQFFCQFKYLFMISQKINQQQTRPEQA